ncbi:lipoprotein [Caballeronia sordidicola]|uniref:Lipoprotein n=2 Tax=Caballeronia sordidicola TaxID=196367 RepID=A0A158F7D1_CABSO|nr:lipoprotein [Caballeronia sordidicola]
MRPMFSSSSLSSLLCFKSGLFRWLAVLSLSLFLAACGGGGGDSDNNSVSSPGANNGGAGSSDTPGAQPIAATAANTVPITVGPGAQNFINIPNVSVTVCAPGTSTCQTIDNIQVDTGSYGLRLASDAAAQIITNLPINQSTSGGQLAQCTQFADGFTWGTVRTADVKIGGETASAIPVQVVGDLADSTVPASGCINGSNERTSRQLGANGILGVGVSPTDCGTACTNPVTSNYYSCPSGTNCSQVAVAVANQVVNPVTKFATDNNGVIVQLPPVASAAASVTGTLVFGIGTQSNNTLTGATSFRSSAFGNLSGTYKGATVTTIVDSGSNGLFFNDTSLPACTTTFTDFYCPASSQTLSSTVRGLDGTTGTVNFTVANAKTLAGSGTNYALNGLAGNIGSFPTLFDFGLPFFFGRHVYFGFGTNGNSPFVAF